MRAERRSFVFVNWLLQCRFLPTKYLTWTIGSNDINIYFPSNVLDDRVSLSDTAEAEP